MGQGAECEKARRSLRLAFYLSPLGSDRVSGAVPGAVRVRLRSAGAPQYHGSGQEPVATRPVHAKSHAVRSDKS